MKLEILYTTIRFNKLLTKYLLKKVNYLKSFFFFFFGSTTDVGQGLPVCDKNNNLD